MKLGVFIPLTQNPDPKFKKVRDLGFPTCQLNGWVQNLFTKDIAHQVVAASKKYGIQITSFWCGWEGPAIWDFVDGPLTLGLVPPAYRQDRLKMLKKGSDFATWMDIHDVTTHVGFIPEDPNHPEYPGLVTTLRYLTQYCRGNGQNFLFETGQETPITLLRIIEDIGLDNLGINLDPANLILYGKANPVDSLNVYGKYVKGVHAKDGLYPTTGRYLGKEVPMGQGKVNFPAFITRLKEVGYDGPLTIEREISGEEQTRDILAAKELLEKYI
jgi:sugar phosphate isomerase/epimerase